MNSKRNIAVVTGGAGFIGSHMVDLLSNKGFEVRIIDNLLGGHLNNINHHKKNKKIIFEKLDINKINSDNKIFKNVKYIFHFAGIGDIVPSVENPKKYIDTNTIGTLNILEGARKNNIQKFLYAASSSCYGLAKTPTSEKHLINPQYPYALSKYIGEKYVFHWNKVYNLKTISLRIFNAYGTRVRTTGAYGAVFGVFLKQKLAGKPFTVVGDGNQARDFIYVTDICDAFYKAAKSKYTSEIFNVGEGKAKKINYLVKLLGKNKIVYLPSRPGEPKITLANINKIQNYIKWKPKIKFEHGVLKMLDNINDWQNAPLWNKNSIEQATKTWFKYLK